MKAESVSSAAQLNGSVHPAMAAKIMKMASEISANGNGSWRNQRNNEISK